MNAKDTIIINDDLTKCSITNRITEKYARKLLQQYLKDYTKIKSWWSLYYDYTDEYAYHFTISNPILHIQGIELARYKP